MRELTLNEIDEISGAWKFRINLRFVVTGFTAFGAFLLGGPAGAGMVLSAAVATSGVENLAELYGVEVY